MTPDKTLKGRFILGKEITPYEVREAFKRIYNRPAPKGAKPVEMARRLSAHHPLRFEFEINRLRGYAWDAEEPLL